jgi:hypothetical protein
MMCGRWRLLDAVHAVTLRPGEIGGVKQERCIPLSKIAQTRIAPRIINGGAKSAPIEQRETLF